MAVECRWQAVGCSVRGASHERSGLPNQDAIGWEPAESLGPPLWLAVSDGHGSPKCFRSEVGARLSVECALAAFRELISPQIEPAGHSAIKRIAEETLPQMVARHWREAVDADLATRPFEPTELDRLEAAQGSGARQAAEAHPRLAYGATAIAVLVAESFLLYFQIGDGDIITVAEDGRVTRPLPVDERLFGNETTSLSAGEAWRDARVAFQTLAGAPPALIILSTDGYANSFPSEEEFLKVGPDLLELLRQEGVKAVAAGLPEWLAEASRDGSGDDVTVGVICRLEALTAQEGPAELADHGAKSLIESTEAVTPPLEVSSPADRPMVIVPKELAPLWEPSAAARPSEPPMATAMHDRTVEQAEPLGTEGTPVREADDGRQGQAAPEHAAAPRRPLWTRLWRSLLGRKWRSGDDG